MKRTINTYHTNLHLTIHKISISYLTNHPIWTLHLSITKQATNYSIFFSEKLHLLNLCLLIKLNTIFHYLNLYFTKQICIIKLSHNFLTIQFQTHVHNIKIFNLPHTKIFTITNFTHEHDQESINLALIGMFRPSTISQHNSLLNKIFLQIQKKNT